MVSAQVAIEWRLAERYGPKVTPERYVDGTSFRFELEARAEARLEGAEQASWRPALDRRLEGRRVRVRARAVASDGVVSRWSPPLELLVGAPVDPQPPLVVSELMYHCASPDVDSLHEYIEFVNAGKRRRWLAGVRVDGGIRYRFADNATIEPGATLLLARDPAAFEARYGVKPHNSEPYDGRLSNGGEAIEVKDVRGAIIDRIVYGTRFPSVHQSRRSVAPTCQ
jgi:hypothetical protein